MYSYDTCIIFHYFDSKCSSFFNSFAGKRRWRRVWMGKVWYCQAGIHSHLDNEELSTSINFYWDPSNYIKLHFSRLSWLHLSKQRRQHIQAAERSWKCWWTCQIWWTQNKRTKDQQNENEAWMDTSPQISITDRSWHLYSEISLAESSIHQVKQGTCAFELKHKNRWLQLSRTLQRHQGSKPFVGNQGQKTAAQVDSQNDLRLQSGSIKCFTFKQKGSMQQSEEIKMTCWHYYLAFPKPSLVEGCALLQCCQGTEGSPRQRVKHQAMKRHSKELICQILTSRTERHNIVHRSSPARKVKHKANGREVKLGELALLWWKQNSCWIPLSCWNRFLRFTEKATLLRSQPSSHHRYTAKTTGCRSWKKDFRPHIFGIQS